MIEISQVINYLQELRGPNSIVVMADFYDYTLTTQVFQLPDDDLTVVNQIEEIMNTMIDPGAEDSSAFIVWVGGKRTWDHTDITNMGRQTVLKELMDLLRTHYDGQWQIGGYQSGNESWEVEYRRHNFG